MARIHGSGSSRRYRTTKENLKVACANLSTGQAADSVSVTLRQGLDRSKYLHHKDLRSPQ